MFLGERGGVLLDLWIAVSWVWFAVDRRSKTHLVRISWEIRWPGWSRSGLLPCIRCNITQICLHRSALLLTTSLKPPISVKNLFPRLTLTAYWPTFSLSPTQALALPLPLHFWCWWSLSFWWWSICKDLRLGSRSGKVPRLVASQAIWDWLSVSCLGREQICDKIAMVRSESAAQLLSSVLRTLALPRSYKSVIINPFPIKSILCLSQ